MSEQLLSPEQEYQRALETAKGLLQERKERLEEDNKVFTDFLETDAYTHTERGRGIREEMAGIVSDNELAVEWLEQGNSSDEAVLAVSKVMDRFAEHASWYARENLGGERLTGDADPDTITATEKEALRISGELTYFADILRSRLE